MHTLSNLYIKYIFDLKSVEKMKKSKERKNINGASLCRNQ